MSPACGLVPKGKMGIVLPPDTTDMPEREATQHTWQFKTKVMRAYLLKSEMWVPGQLWMCSTIHMQPCALGGTWLNSRLDHPYRYRMSIGHEFS